MPSTSTLSDDEKAKVKRAVPPPTNKIFFAASASIYYTHPLPNEWSCAGLQGALVFSQNTKDNSFHLQMVELDGTGGVIWDHELCEGLEFNQDTAFFHSFAGDTCMIGFMYSDEVEAKTLHKKVKTKMNKESLKPKSERKKVSKGGKIERSLISAPRSGSFIHVAHMGYDANSGFTPKGVDPSWTALLGNLENTIPREVIERDMEFIKDFVRGYPDQQQPAAKDPKKPKPPPPPKRPHRNGGSISSPITPATHAPLSRSKNRHLPPPLRPPADPFWTALLGNLENTVPREVIERDMEFIKDFVRGYPDQQQPAAKDAKKPKLPPPPKRPHGNGGSISSPITPATQAPPWRFNNCYPPPPPRPPVPASASRHVPPSVPAPVAQQSSQTPAPPHSPGEPAPPQNNAPPPAGPQSGSAPAPPAPPYPCTMTSGPPLPPAQPAAQDYNGGSAAPPPPPPPAQGPSSGGAPHSPSPPPSVAPPSAQRILPPAKPGRSDLLASIQAWRLNVSSFVGDGQEAGGGDDVDDGDDWDNVDEDEDWDIVKEAVAGPNGSR